MSSLLYISITYYMQTEGQGVQSKNAFIINVRNFYGGRSIDNTDGVGNPARCIHLGRPFADPGPANGLPRWIQGVRIFCHVCIVFISPPVVELCVLFMHRIVCVVYFAPIGSGQGGGMGKNYF